MHVYTAGFLSVSQVETTPSQFADPSVYLWNISNNGELLRLEGLSAPPLRRTTHCADYATIRQQVHPPSSPAFSSFLKQLLITFAKGGSISWLVCQQDNAEAKATEQIYHEVWMEDTFQPRTDHFYFGCESG